MKVVTKVMKMMKGRSWAVAAVTGAVAFVALGVVISAVDVDARSDQVEPSRSEQAASVSDVESPPPCTGPVMSPLLMARFESTMNDMIDVLPRFDELAYLPFAAKIEAYKEAAYYSAVLESIVEQSPFVPFAVKDGLRKAERSFADAAYTVSQQMALSWSGASDEELLASLEEEVMHLGDGLAYVANAWSRLNGCEVPGDY